ncbi:MAG: hypothetical protein CMO49_00960 [Verrucomicrobiales bacterium]|nr:hypothetical protein [Verrucomicrobiales bacterium]
MSFSFRELFNKQEKEQIDPDKLSFIESQPDDSQAFFNSNENDAQQSSPFELVDDTESQKVPEFIPNKFEGKSKSNVKDIFYSDIDNNDELEGSGFIIDDDIDHYFKQSDEVEHQSSEVFRERNSPHKVHRSRGKVKPLEELDPIANSERTRSEKYDQHMGDQELLFGDNMKIKHFLDSVNNMIGIKGSGVLFYDNKPPIFSPTDTPEDPFNQINELSEFIKNNRNQLRSIHCLNYSLSFIHFSIAQLVLVTDHELKYDEIRSKIMVLYDEIASDSLFY